MEIITLIIKEKFLNEIIAGTKTVETRDIRPNTFSKYYNLDDEGEATGLRHYDAIQFYHGYEKNRKAALVEIVSAEMFVMADEDDQDIIYLHKGKEYVETIAEYTLGRVLSKNF